MGLYMTDIKQLLGTNIKIYRKSCNLTQAKLAEKVNTATNYISAIEAGRRFPSVRILEKIALVLGIDTPRLFVTENIHIYEMKAELEQQVWLNIGQIISNYVSESLTHLKDRDLKPKEPSQIKRKC
jgi:transcriptional regulator with XRE-family HTH domain